MIHMNTPTFLPNHRAAILILGVSLVAIGYGILSQGHLVGILPAVFGAAAIFIWENYPWGVATYIVRACHSLNFTNVQLVQDKNSNDEVVAIILTKDAVIAANIAIAGEEVEDAKKEEA